MPQSALDVPVWQLPLPSQQPLAQLVASHLHTPLAHSCPVGQTTQAPPSAPQAAFVGGLMHDVPLQQPVAQSPALQYATQF